MRVFSVLEQATTTEGWADRFRVHFFEKADPGRTDESWAVGLDDRHFPPAFDRALMARSSG